MKSLFIICIQMKSFSISISIEWDRTLSNLQIAWILNQDLDEKLLCSEGTTVLYVVFVFRVLLKGFF